MLKRVPEIRKGTPDPTLGREEFIARYRSQYQDEAFVRAGATVQAMAEAAWEVYDQSRKASRWRKAGPGFADPDEELDVEWLEARERILEAEKVHRDPAGPPRLLLVNGSPRTEWTCPGEKSKTLRLLERAEKILREEQGCGVELLNLSRLTSEYGRKIHPCKACVSTAMPLCHWPCSCYPNYALGQSQDWMNEIYGMWVRAHGVMIVTPVHWYQVPSALKLMIDRLVCADGGNPDPTSTGGKDAERAKKLELAGWDYPKHLAGRLFSVIAHGDAGGAEHVRQALSDWLNDIGLESASPQALLDRYIGYMETYALSHEALDRDEAIFMETENAARALAEAVKLRRSGKLPPRPRGGRQPRQK